MSLYQVNLYVEPVVYMFYKDLHSVFIGCNKAFAEISGLQCATDIIGKSDYDMPWRETEGDLYREGDKAVLDGVILNNAVESQNLACGKKNNILINKIPLLDSFGNTIGIMGSYVNILDQSTHGAKCKLLKNVPLSERQLECLTFLAKGFTAKRIANCMKITERTVQTHIEKLKEKLSCFSKQELIDFAWRSELIKNKLFSIDN